MKPITKQLYNRFVEAPIEVRTINGSFQRATKTVTYANGHSWEIGVNVSHPLLNEFVSTKRERWLTEPTSKNSAIVYYDELPEELMPMFEELVEAATISDETAKALRETLINSLMKLQQEMAFR